ncbi:hypothetical protein HQN90_29790 [Paenibacillus alba]|uniref:hypothetical protein n=1 Tax=Paenibacillus alba TaxID=1197127 RepID=UPI001567BC62|nr:hypothetical protein [Paenibacillus alba]NQX70339.1 hypothetical protein [Paenibacillus alba]
MRLKISLIFAFFISSSLFVGVVSADWAKGTGYYEIIGIEVNEAIAIKDDKGLYIKATYGGEYAGDRYNGIDFFPYVLAVLLVFISGYLLRKKINR